MKKKRYLMFQIPEGYVKNIHTGVTYTKEMELCCQTAGDDNIYLEYPIMDYPDNYICVDDSGRQFPMVDILKSNNFYTKKYAVITDRTKLAGWEWFYIGECEKFYTIEIRDDILDFFKEIGFDNIKISPDLFQFKLINMKELNTTNGTEILLFADSNDLSIRAKLNQKKKEILFDNIETSAIKKVCSGIFTVIDNFVTNITYYSEDKDNFESAINSNSDILINNNVEYKLSNKQIISLNEGLKYNQKVVLTYKDILISYIDEKITDIISMEELNKNENFLFFGYTNQEISDKMKKEFGGNYELLQ